MSLSLKELKEQLVSKGGYTITPKYSQLDDLRTLIDNMMAVRNEASPSTGSGYYSGTNCIGHQPIIDFDLSLGDFNSIDIKGCSCDSVDDRKAYCRSRTYYCSCNSNTPTCQCNSRTPTSCTCQNRVACDCVWAAPDGTGTSLPTCGCNSRTSESCSCLSRTSSCGSRNSTSCSCNGRCACNSEKRFD